MKEKTLLPKEMFVSLFIFKRPEISFGKTSGKFRGSILYLYFKRKKKESSELPTESERKRMIREDVGKICKKVFFHIVLLHITWASFTECHNAGL